MQKKKLKELIISWFGSKESYNLHKSENPDGLNLVPLDFDSSLQENGWRKTADGFIEQWGWIDKKQDMEWVIFPIAFNEAFAAFTQSTQVEKNDEYNNGNKVTTLENDRMFVMSNESPSAVFWWAIGK